MTRRRVQVGAILAWIVLIGFSLAVWFVAGYVTRRAYLLGEL